MSKGTQGFALIAVLVALSILLALAAPFLLSMGHGDEAARQEVEAKRVDWAVDSVRDFLLGNAAKSSFAEDLTPLVDSLDEYPSSVELPEGFEALTERGKVRLGGEVWDLQRKIDLNSATPLLLANLLGLGARLSEEHEGEWTEVKVDDASGFPEQGYLIINREIVQYGERDDSTFRDLTRGLFIAEGFRPAYFETPDGEPVKTGEGTLVLDFRTVLAVAFPFWGDQTKLEQYGTVRELQRFAQLGFPGFDRAELDELERHCTVGSRNQHSSRFGKPERVFGIWRDEMERQLALRVRSAADIGGGSLIRIRSTDGTRSEYNMVWSTSIPGGQQGAINLPANWWITVVKPLVHEYVPTETIVERVVPVPVNVNTASEEILTALIQSMRVKPRSMVAGGHRESIATKPYYSRRQAQSMAERIYALRTYVPGIEDEVEADDIPGPFNGWEDFEKRLFRPWFAEATTRDRLRLLVLLYDNFQTGRPGGGDMGTLPICFTSSQLVGYRAAASRVNPLRGAESARLEKHGIAIAAPGKGAAWYVGTQAQFEDLFRLDRNAPFWLTYPINTSALQPFDRGTDPAVRTFSQVVADAYPNAGFGNARFPDADGSEGGFQLSPSNTPFGGYDQNQYRLESFSTALHPEGREIARQGVYEIDNSGPRGQGNTSRQASHERIQHQLTSTGGLTSRHAIQFWFQVDDTGQQVLYDLSVPQEGFPDRNRISLQIRDQNLVLEVIDEAGVDPDPSVINTTPQRTTGVWEVPITDINLQADRWYHASLSAMGNRPNQMHLLIDGVPRGEPRMRTYLAQQIPAFQFSQQLQQQQIEAELHRPIVVESTEGFPPRGVLKIGNELFEYTSLDGSTFYTTHDDSFGGRLQRQRINEFGGSTPPANGTYNRQNLSRILRGTRQAIAIEHNVGAVVELYGYSLPAYPRRFIEAGGANLVENVGPFTVARVINQQSSNTNQIVVQIPLPNQPNQTFPFLIGNGIDDQINNEIVLGDPRSAPLNAASASQEILSGFPESGGYALMIQRPITFGPQSPGGTDVPVGGWEIIRYSGRQGDRLTGLQRGQVLQIDGVDFFADDNFDPTQPIRRFVTEWTGLVLGGQPPPPVNDLNLLPRFYTYIMPISLTVSGTVPTGSGTVEWLQIMPRGDEVDTEWVRYNTVLENRFVVRAEQRAFNQVLVELSGTDQRRRFGLQQGASSIQENDGGGTEPYPAPIDPRPNSIGYIDQVETQHPACFYARRGLGFRGDPFTGTTSHTHTTADRVLPVHRFEFDWSRYGALAPRPGRNDRIGLVQGSARANAQVPGVEWQVVNWAVRHYNADNLNQASIQGNQRNQALEDLGPTPFVLVGLKDVVTAAYLGGNDQSRDTLDDSRMIDRAVKFPSGELPAADVEFASIGETGHQDQLQMRGVVDEVAAQARMVTPKLLDSSLTETGREFFIRNRFAITPLGPFFDAQPRHWANWGNNAQFPEDGGLLWIDGEILAYSNFSLADFRFQIASDGRGLLGTEPKQHDPGTMVYFLEQVPCEILTQGVGPNDSRIQLSRLGGFPRHGGMALLGTEVFHYTWTEANTTLAMPEWYNPAFEGSRPEGLLRGRFGTNPVSAGSGSPVIWFPFRYWDRHRMRGNDPAQSYTQYTFEPGPSWIRKFGWKEEGNSLLVDLQCVVRLDQRGTWESDPEDTPGLFHLRDGQVNDDLVPIGSAASRLEARFFVEYRPGCFDSQTFLAQDWKYTPIVREFAMTYESEGRILSEWVTAR